MDPLSAIGLASAVVQFVDFGLKIAARLSEFSSKNPSDVPRSLQSICTQLPLLLSALRRISTASQIAALDFDTKCILRGMISGCKSQVEEVESIIDDIAKRPGDSLKTKLRKVWTSLRYDEKVWEIEKNLHSYVQILILHHVVDIPDERPVWADDGYFDVRERRVEPFVERKRPMKELEGYLHLAARSMVEQPTTVLIEGEKAAGKTQLILEYCHQAHALQQFQSVFWLDASTLENLSLGIEGMYATIKKSTAGLTEEKIDFVKKFLSNLWHPWLLVLDNYEPTSFPENPLTFLPNRGYGGVILVTNDQEHRCDKILRVPKFLTKEDQIQLNRLLAQAVQNKNLEGIKNLVHQGADVDSVDQDNWPVLHRCALFGLEEAVSFLLSMGANPNPPLLFPKPLYWAATGGHEAICCLLLEHEDETGVMGNEADYQSAFNAAVEAGRLAIVSMIYQRREVTVNGSKSINGTPLQRAAQRGHVETVKFLIDHGALLEDQLQKNKALTLAASTGHLSVVKLLILDGKVDPNTKDSEGKTALYHAAKLQDCETGQEIAKFLLENGTDPNLFDKCEGLLHATISKGDFDLLRLLIEHGGDPTREFYGTSSLIYAIQLKNGKIVTFLLGTPIKESEARKKCLERALRYACNTGERDAILKLINTGVDLNATEESGSWKGATPLLLALLFNHLKIAQLLVRHGARQDIADETGRFPLPLAAEMGDDILVRNMIRKGGDPNLKSGKDENTPLILAAAKGHGKVVKVLLENGADREVVNRFGETALDVAEEKGAKDVIELLEG